MHETIFPNFIFTSKEIQGYIPKTVTMHRHFCHHILRWACHRFGTDWFKLFCPFFSTSFVLLWLLFELQPFRTHDFIEIKPTEHFRCTAFEVNSMYANQLEENLTDQAMRMWDDTVQPSTPKSPKLPAKKKWRRPSLAANSLGNIHNVGLICLGEWCDVGGGGGGGREPGKGFRIWRLAFVEKYILFKLAFGSGRISTGFARCTILGVALTLYGIPHQTFWGENAFKHVSSAFRRFPHSACFLVRTLHEYYLQMGDNLMEFN